MPFNINGWELVIVVILFLMLFGPDRLPEVAVQIGKLVREVRKASQAATSEITREFEIAANEAGTSAQDIRNAGETARRVVQDTSRAVSAVVGSSGVREIGAAVNSAADAARGAGGSPATGGSATGAAATGTTAAGAAAVGSTSAGSSSAPAAGTIAESQPAAVGDSAAGDPEADNPMELPEPIDVDMLARRIAPFDLDSGAG